LHGGFWPRPKYSVFYQHFAGRSHSEKKKDKQLKQEAISHPLVADAIEIFEGKLVDVKVL
jgi:hypothetical protein